MQTSDSAESQALGKHLFLYHAFVLHPRETLLWAVWWQDVLFGKFCQQQELVSPHPLILFAIAHLSSTENRGPMLAQHWLMLARWHEVHWILQYWNCSGSLTCGATRALVPVSHANRRCVLLTLFFFFSSLKRDISTSLPSHLPYPLNALFLVKHLYFHSYFCVAQGKSRCCCRVVFAMSPSFVTVYYIILAHHSLSSVLLMFSLDKGPANGLPSSWFAWLPYYSVSTEFFIFYVFLQFAVSQCVYAKSLVAGLLASCFICNWYIVCGLLGLSFFLFLFFSLSCAFDMLHLFIATRLGTLGASQLFPVQYFDTFVSPAVNAVA